MAISLSNVVRNREPAPPRVVVYGVDGIGKSTFAAGAPDPIFIFTEDSLGTLDVAHFPVARTAQDVTDCVTALYSEPHEYGTIVLDTADWAEALIEAEIGATHDAKDLAYGKGAVKQAEAWRQLLAGFDALRNERRMAVIILAHCEIRRFDSPETEPYDRYQLKLQARSSDVLREWADAVLFANYRTVVKKSDVGFQKTVARGVSSGERLLHCNDRPAYRAKNRYGLPDELPLTWDALASAITASTRNTAP